ncbi:MAG: hypothetical protein AAGD25_29350 [Cyanobacteria bacterium P01_F01_bin.150]
MKNKLLCPWATSKIKLFLLAGCALSVPFAVNAQTIETIDTQPNDTFGDRVTVSPGVNRIYGELSPVALPPADYMTENFLEVGTVDEVQLTNLPPDSLFFAWITMENNNMDPILGLFDSEGNLIRWDDDSSPATPFAPAIRGTIAKNGTLSLKISGTGDEDFDGDEIYYYNDAWNGDEVDESSPITGPHYQVGEYTLSVATDIVDLEGDLDFFTLSGLTPGHGFTIAESMSEYGVRFGWLDDDGTVTSVSHYSEITYREQLEGTVPATGQLNIVVSGYDDESFDGQHTNSGEYVLQVNVQPPD